MSDNNNGEYLLGLYEESRQDLEKIITALNNLESLAASCDQRMLKEIYQDNAERAQTHLDFIRKLIEMEEKMFQIQDNSQDSTSIRATPIHFIIPDSNKQLIVNPEASARLESIRGPVVIISVAGMFRTGKSYVLNRLAGQQRGFMLGPNVQSCTKGIWLWCTPITVKRDGVDARVILLDTEGLGDSEKGDQNYDTAIFTLAILLSSYFIYNNMRTIDEEALQALYLVGEMANHVQVKSGQEENGEERQREFPAFCWLVRDSELELAEGQSAKDHMEDILALKRGASKKIKDYNEKREAIKQLFRRRECFLLRKPIEDEEQLRRVDQLSDDQLHPEFLKQSDSFVKHVLSSVPVKKVLGKSISGLELGGLASTYVQAVNEGAIPIISDAFQSLVEVQGNRAVSLATKTYSDSLSVLVESQGGLPMSQRRLVDFHGQSSAEANEQFSRSCMRETERFAPILNENVRETYEQYVKNNEELAEQVCKANLQKNYGPIQEKLQGITYLNNRDALTEDIEELTALYLSETEALPRSTDILNEFLGNEIEHVIEELESSIQVKQRKFQKMEKEKQRTDQMTQKLNKDQDCLIATKEEKNRMLEDNKRQQDEMKRDMADGIRKMEDQSRDELRAREEQVRRNNEEQVASMQTLFQDNLRCTRDEMQQQSSKGQRDIENLNALLNQLRQQQQQLHNRKH